MENSKRAIDLAFSGNINNMSQEIESVLMQKIADSLESKRIEVAQSFMQQSNEDSEPFDDFEEEDLEEAWPKDTSDYTPDDDGEPEFKGHMDDHPEYKKVAGYGKYREFGVHKSNGKNPWTVPYIVSDDSGKAVHWTNDRRYAHRDAKELASKAKYPERIKRIKESYIEEKLSASDDISVWIKDFIESDNPRFAGKSKAERIEMAKGAYYSAKKGNK